MGLLARIAAAGIVALADPNVAKQFAEMELIAGGGSPQAFQSHIRAEVKRWGELVKARGIHAEELR